MVKIVKTKENQGISGEEEKTEPSHKKKKSQAI